MIMNKQEVIKKIEDAIPDFILNDYHRGKETGLTYALELVEELAEPEKPVVPQFVADWYEEHKEDFEYNLYRLNVNFHERNLNGDLYEWFRYDKNKPIETLVLMHKFGYEVKKEKLYTVEIPNQPDAGHLVLTKDNHGGLFIDWRYTDSWKEFKKVQLTEAEIKEDFAWAWQFAKEVEE